jgi:phosphate uptake regulator
MLQEIGLCNRTDCLSYRLAVRGIERVADNAAGIAEKCLKIADKIPEEVFQEIDKMSKMSMSLLNKAVEAFLRRDYYLADCVVDKGEIIRSLEAEIISFIDKEKKIYDYE